MRISNAKVGDVLRDRLGAVWLMEPEFAAMMAEPRPSDLGGGTFALHPVRMTASRAEAFGPFVRLVPEKEGGDAK